MAGRAVMAAAETAVVMIGSSMMLLATLSVVVVAAETTTTTADPPSPTDERPYCPDYSSYAYASHPPLSGGRFRLPYQRPDPVCRTFNLTEVEDTINEMRRLVKDPDLFRLFENCFPNTLDTAITWKGFAAPAGGGGGNSSSTSSSSSSSSGSSNSGGSGDSSSGSGGSGRGGGRGDDRQQQQQQQQQEEGNGKEELTYITTGDINAMWLRDSANQLQSYKTLLRANASQHSLASLYRGAINLQARYITSSPHCNAFQAPVESNLSTSAGGYSSTDYVSPPTAWNMVHECKYELDSLAAFLQLSHDYFTGTGDAAFFARTTDNGNGGWRDAVDTVLTTATALLEGTYAEDGSVRSPPYKFQRQTSTSTETLSNSGAGNPVKAGTGLVRSAFRPSDDACIYQLFVPANMMFSRYLAGCAPIMETIDRRLSLRMSDFAESIRVGIEKYARVDHAVYGNIYAYEIDGFGSYNTMDDANIPSLLSAPMLGYVNKSDPVYQRTRRFVLSKDNPYYMYGPVINGTGGPHVGTGMAWPMSLIVRILTTDDDEEIIAALQQLVSSTDGLGLIHESVNSHSQSQWTRQWFSWANGLFGQMLLDLRDRKPHLLATSFQN